MYVSNWEDVTGSTNIIPQAEEMHRGFVVVQVVLCSCTPLLFVLISVLLFRLLKIDKISREVIQSYPFFVGFFFCMFYFGLAILVTEFTSWSMNANNSFVVRFKYINILLVLVVTGLQTTNLLRKICHSLIREYGHGQICIFCAIMLLISIMFIICCFAVQWAIISLFPTLLLSLAYPLHVTTLFVLHFVFVFALSITIGVFVSEIMSRSNQKCCTCNCTIAGMIILGLAIALYITIICGYVFTIVQRIVPADGVIHGLLFLPSVILILIGWLLKERYFGM